MLRRLLPSLFCCGLFASCAVAQVPSKPSDAFDNSREGFVFERIDNRVHFENDGTSFRDTTVVIRIQSQAGVQQFGQLIFGYSSATETLEVNYVRVRKPGGQVIETPASNTQDFAPEILKEAPMYSDYRQRHISVVGLQAGDVLEYRTIAQTSKPLAVGQFWFEYKFPTGVAIEKDRLEIDVPKSRDLRLKSPDRKYEVHEVGDRRVYSWLVENVAPDRKKKSTDDDLDASELQADIQISTFADWKQVAEWYAKLEGDQAAVDDSLRKKARELTRGVSDAREKVVRLYNFVAQNVRYVSLSFGVGRYQPHSAAEVLQNGYGDCKDKHTLLDSLLRAEGIRSYPVLIHSSRKLDPDIPSPAQFDHVITAVQLDGDLVWLDTTAEVAPFGLILYPLRHKQALLASVDGNAGLRRTPADSPVKDVFTVNIDGKFSPMGSLDAAMDITAQGDSDVPIRAVFRGVPPIEWDKLLKYFSAAWGFDGEVSAVHVGSLEDTSKPLHLSYRYHKDDYFAVPNADARFYAVPPTLLPALKPDRKHAEPLDVGPAMERRLRGRFQFPDNYTVSPPPTVSMTRDYGKYSATYNLTKNTLEVERHVVLTVNELPPSRRSDFESFRNVIGNPVTQLLSFSIVRPSPAAGSVANMSGTAEDLRKTGVTALRHNDFSTAVELLKRALDQDPQQDDTWDDLGRAYAGLNSHEEAVGAFRKQVEINAFHPRANADLAAELQQLGRLDEAVTAYRKQLEIAPTDKSAHKNLGLILAQLGRDQEARSELESAAAIAPDDPEIKIGLAQVYARTGDLEKAQSLTKGILGSTSLAADADIYAQALGDDMNPNEALREARRTLYQIGEQFDSGEYDSLGPTAFSAMNLVALSWARIGWAKFLQGETLEAIQYLNAAWLLSQSGTVANRLARAFEKETQPEKARHMYAMAVAAGGEQTAASQQQLLRLSAGPGAAQQEISQAQLELLQARSVKLSSSPTKNASADFNLVFDGSSRPERAEYSAGDNSLRAAEQQIREKDYPVKFPDVSSVKIVRRGTLSCANAVCTFVLQPLAIRPPSSAAVAGTGQPR